MDRAFEHHHAGRIREAIVLYSLLVESHAQCGNAWRQLGIVALERNIFDSARTMLERALRIDGNDAAAFAALGTLDEAENRLDGAYASYAAAIAIDAHQAAAAIGLARVALRLGRAAEACEIARTVVASGIVDAGLLRTLGSARLTLRDYAGTVDALMSSIMLQPHPDAYANLAIAAARLERRDVASVACDIALSLDPAHAAVLNTLGCIQAAELDFQAAFETFERAIGLGSEQAHLNLGTGYMLLGNYREGWPHFGWETAERRANPAFGAMPMWDGTPAPDRNLLIWPEQGIGDAVQMVRFIRHARDRVGAITLACRPETLDLLRTIDGVDECITIGDLPAWERFDLWLPTVRLPVVFNVASDAIPAAPYLSADLDRRSRFRAHLRATGRLRIGLVWAGSVTHERDSTRSCALAEFDPLGGIPGLAWYALQQGPACSQMSSSAIDLAPINTLVGNFADTAAIIAELDLIITVDTSVAHVAGALGRPAWVMLPNRPDWRWGLHGEVSPWYPTLRLFRQGDDASWAPVITAIAAALRELVEASGTDHRETAALAALARAVAPR